MKAPYWSHGNATKKTGMRICCDNGYFCELVHLSI